MSVPSSGLSKLKKKHFRVKHQKVKLFRANEPLLSVFMWGVNHTVSRYNIRYVKESPKFCEHPHRVTRTVTVFNENKLGKLIIFTQCKVWGSLLLFIVDNVFSTFQGYWFFCLLDILFPSKHLLPIEKRPKQ